MDKLLKIIKTIIFITTIIKKRKETTPCQDKQKEQKPSELKEEA